MKEKSGRIAQWVSIFIFAVVLIIIYKTLDNLTDITNWFKGLFKILTPFIMGTLIAYLLYIPSRFFENIYKKAKILSKASRALSILTTYILMIVLIILVINVIFPIISVSITDLAANIPNFYNKAVEYADNMPENSILDQLHIKESISNISNIDIKQFIKLESIGAYAKGILGLATGVFDIFITLAVSVYLLIYRGKLIDFMRALCFATFEKKTSRNIAEYFNKSNEIFFKFIGGQIFDALIIGIITSIIMSLLGVKYAILLGFLIGLFNIIPYFGAIVAIAIAILITIFTGGWVQAIWMGIAVIIVQQLDANIINPKILGDALEISPLLVIFSVTIGGAYFGIMGMFLAVPIATVIKLLLVEYIEKRTIRKPEII